MSASEAHPTAIVTTDQNDAAPAAPLPRRLERSSLSVSVARIAPKKSQIAALSPRTRAATAAKAAQIATVAITKITTFQAGACACPSDG